MTGGRRHCLAVTGARVEVDLDAGGRAVAWVVEGLDLIGRRGTAAVEHGMYAMAPWAGRLRGNAVTWAGRTYPLPVTHDGWALHGTVLDRPVDVVAADEGPDGARLETVAALGAGWPWPGRLRQVWDLRPGVLHTRLSVESAGPAFPAVVGWHPWFRRRLATGGDVSVDLPATALLERGSDHLPTGLLLPPDARPGPYDDAFVVPSGRATLTWPGALRLAVTSDVGWYVRYDELADWVCLEPQSGPPDGLGESAGVARPGHPVTASAAWRFCRE